MRTMPMGKSRITFAALLMAGAAALGLSGTSHAGCAPGKWSDARQAAPTPGAAMSIAAGNFIQVSDRESARTIVGLWKFEMISKSTAKHTNPMPDGTLIDFGTAAAVSGHPRGFSAAVLSQPKAATIYGLTNFSVMRSDSPMARYLARSFWPSASVGGSVHTPCG